MPHLVNPVEALLRAPISAQRLPNKVGKAGAENEGVCKNCIPAIPNKKHRIAQKPFIKSATPKNARAITKDDAMTDFVDGTAFNHEQGNRARKLFAAVVLAALDDAIADDKKYGNGPEQIARWARSRDGREVLTCAGIDPNERVVQGLMEFVGNGVRTSVALSREESERRHAAEAAERAKAA
jgi:hypothetical protein